MRSGIQRKLLLLIAGRSLALIIASVLVSAIIFLIWGISLEACENGRVEKIDFDANMSKEIDGMPQNMENQDGVDVLSFRRHVLVKKNSVK